MYCAVNTCTSPNSCSRALMQLHWRVRLSQPPCLGCGIAQTPLWSPAEMLLPTQGLNDSSISKQILEASVSEAEQTETYHEVAILFCDSSMIYQENVKENKNELLQLLSSFFFLVVILFLTWLHFINELTWSHSLLFLHILHFHSSHIMAFQSTVLSHH